MSLLQEARNIIMAPIRARQEREQLREMDRRLLHEDLQGMASSRIDDVFHRYVEILTDGEFPNIPRVEVAASAMKLLVSQRGSDLIHQDRGMTRLRGSFDEPHDKVASLLIDQIEEDFKTGRVDPMRLFNKYSFPSLVGLRSNLGRRLAHAGY